MKRSRKRAGAKEREPGKASYEELVAFEAWFYSVKEHAHWHAFTPAYALAYLAWQAGASRLAQKGRK